MLYSELCRLKPYSVSSWRKQLTLKQPADVFLEHLLLRTSHYWKIRPKSYFTDANVSKHNPVRAARQAAIITYIACICKAAMEINKIWLLTPFALGSPSFQLVNATSDWSTQTNFPLPVSRSDKPIQKFLPWPQSQLFRNAWKNPFTLESVYENVYSAKTLSYFNPLPNTMVEW